MNTRRTPISLSEAKYLLHEEAHSRQTIFSQQTRTVVYQLKQYDLGLNYEYPKLQVYEAVTLTIPIPTR